jgi:hypothetical protein
MLSSASVSRPRSATSFSSSTTTMLPLSACDGSKPAQAIFYMPPVFCAALVAHCHTHLDIAHERLLALLPWAFRRHTPSPHSQRRGARQLVLVLGVEREGWEWLEAAGGRAMRALFQTQTYFRFVGFSEEN